MRVRPPDQRSPADLPTRRASRMGLWTLMRCGLRPPGCAHRVHLNNAGAALLAQPTLDAMLAHLRLEAEIGGYEAADAAQPQIAAAYDPLVQVRDACHASHGREYRHRPRHRCYR